VRSNFLLSFIRALKLPLKLLAGFLRKSKYQKIPKKNYEPKFKKNEKSIESLFKGKRSSKNKPKNNLIKKDTKQVKSK
jgi:hypothetical protein